MSGPSAAPRRALAIAALAVALLLGWPALATACAPPASPKLPNTDGARAAHSSQALFRRVAIPGFTDQRKDTAGVAVEDFNRDGRADLFVIYNDGSMRMLLGRGCMRFRVHPFAIVDSPYTYADPPGGAAIPNWVDLNGDGYLDAFISHNTDGANITQRATTPSAGNSLLMSRGAFDRFKEEASQLGVTNDEAYNRASSIADVNGDGHLDIAVGSDQIGLPQFGGGSIQRLYIWNPSRHAFADVGGTGRVPGFGGPLHCVPALDKASPGILLRDLDGDLKPDLVQGYHDDMLAAKQSPNACVTGERPFGLTEWRNVSRAGRTQFAHVPRRRAGLGGEGRMAYDEDLHDYRVVSHGLGLPYVFAADAFNTGRLDLIAVGPTDPEFHVNSDMIAGKFFHNLGGMRFADQTDQRGLAALNWDNDRWAAFYHAPVVQSSPLMQVACPVSNRVPTCQGMTAGEHKIYASTIAWGDFDNDGCLDFVESDRHEDPANQDGLRNTLFLNTCHGGFRPVRTQRSGLDTNTVSVEVADMNGDGLLDLVSGAQPTNSYPLASPPLPDDRYDDKVWLNTGAGAARRNHWVELDLGGRPQRQLVGAELTLTALGGGGPRFLGRRDYVTSDSYKSGRWPVVHWGLGTQHRARVDVALRSGRHLRLALPCVDRKLVVDVASQRVTGCAGTAGRRQPTR
jgi:hypothetical protein